LLLSLTTDRLDPIAFGFAQLEGADLPPDRQSMERIALLEALRQLSATIQAKADGPVILAR
jgi:hypothetical protein